MNNDQIENTDSAELIQICDRIIVKLCRRGADDPIFRRVKRYSPEMPKTLGSYRVKVTNAYLKTISEFEPLFVAYWDPLSRCFHFSDRKNWAVIGNKDIEWWCEL